MNAKTNMKASYMKRHSVLPNGGFGFTWRRGCLCMVLVCLENIFRPSFWQ